MSEHIPGQEALPLYYISIPDLKTLGALYMPFIRNGGFFIPTSNTCAIGTPVFLLFRLMNESRHWPVCAKIIWLAPEKAQGNRPGGIGVRFMGGNNRLKSRLDTLIAETEGPGIGSAIV